MQDYLLDDDFFDELIKKDQPSSENIQEEILQEEKAVNILKVDEPLKTTEVNTPVVNLKSSENIKPIEMVCGFKSKRICNSTCKYFSSCSRRPDKGSVTKNNISAHDSEIIKKESLEKENLEVTRGNDKETVDSMLDKYYRWLLAEGFMEMPAQKFVGIMRNYHEYSLEDGKESPLLPCESEQLKERFQSDIKYIPKLSVRVGKMKVDSARKYYINFMKDYNKGKINK